MSGKPLPALAQPIGLFPAYIAKQNECLVIKGRYVSDSLDVTTVTGQTLLTIKDRSLSMSSRKTIVETSTNTPLCIIHKESRMLHDDEYYLEAPDGFQRLMKFAPRSSSKMDDMITFANALAGGAPIEPFYHGDSGMELNGSIVERSTGRLVADVDRQPFKLREEFHVSVAQGMDLVVVVAICAFVIENSSSAAALGGGGT